MCTMCRSRRKRLTIGLNEASFAPQMIYILIKLSLILALTSLVSFVNAQTSQATFPNSCNPRPQDPLENSLPDLSCVENWNKLASEVIRSSVYEDVLTISMYLRLSSCQLFGVQLINHRHSLDGLQIAFAKAGYSEYVTGKVLEFMRNQVDLETMKKAIELRADNRYRIFFRLLINEIVSRGIPKEPCDYMLAAEKNYLQATLQQLK